MKPSPPPSPKDPASKVPAELRPFFDELSAWREHAYKHGFWFGVVLTATLLLAAFLSAVFLGL